jgi:hypothetical protein
MSHESCGASIADCDNKVAYIFRELRKTIRIDTHGIGGVARIRFARCSETAARQSNHMKVVSEKWREIIEDVGIVFEAAKKNQ